MEAIEKVDVCGMSCPMPLIKLRASINKLSKGQALTIIGDDPIFESSVRDFCTENGFALESVGTEGRVITMIIRL